MSMNLVNASTWNLSRAARPRLLAFAASVALSSFVPACGDDDAANDGSADEHDHANDDHDHAADDAGQDALAQTLFVAHEGSLVSYDIKTGKERPGAVQQVTTPTDMQALADGTLLVNLTDRGEILTVDPRTMLELDRLPSSAKKAVRPVHSYLSPERKGKSYWMTLNDGTEGDASTDSARFVDVMPESKKYLQAVGEVPLGIGHHKASFSSTQERLVISNISDCDKVLGVFDYSDIANIKQLANASAEDLGWDGSSFEKTCDVTYAKGLPPAPHGCATSKVSGKAYCNLTGSGGLVAIDVDADEPTFTTIPTHGSGGGYTKASHDGKYIYSLEGEPREGSDGAVDCQIGQLVVLDASTDKIAMELPLLYKGPDCTDKLVGTDEETTEPSHSLISEDDDTLYITTAGGFQNDAARVRQHLFVDISDPTKPVQLPSVEVGTSTGYHGDSLSGDGKWLFVANNIDGTVTQIDTAKLEVAKTLKVKAKPVTLATFGSDEGPSFQTGPIH
jgi:hypothetical protein